MSVTAKKCAARPALSCTPIASISVAPTWLQARDWLGLLGFGLSASLAPASAKPLEYCLAVDTAAEPPKHVDAPRRTPEVTFSSNGKTYHITTAAIGPYLELHDKDRKVLQQWRLRQDFGGVINDLVLFDNGWLWISASGPDYAARVRYSAGIPVIEQPTVISDMALHPCSAIQRWLLGCDPAPSYYSASTKRVLITGHAPSRFGFTREKTIEIDAGSVRPLNELINYRVGLREIPAHGALISSNAEGMPIYFDRNGFHKLDLTGSSLPSSVYANGPIGRGWWRSITAEGRRGVFILTGGRGSPGPDRRLVEVLPGGATRQIKGVPDLEDPIWISDLGTKEYFLRGGRWAAVVVDGIATVIAQTGSNAFFSRGWTTPNRDGAIAVNFLVVDKTSRASKTYSLTPNGVGRFCDLPIDSDKPIFLDPTKP